MAAASGSAGRGPARVSLTQAQAQARAWAAGPGDDATEVLPWYEGRRREIGRHPMVRGQALGMALARADLERLGSYETHLDRKLLGLLGLLFRLREARRTVEGTAA